MAKSSDLEQYHKLLDELIKATGDSGSSVYRTDKWKDISKDFRDTLAETESLLDRSLINCTPIQYANESLFRAIKAQYQQSPLSWDGSLYGHGRFHRKGQPTLYFAEEVGTISEEIPAFNFANYQHLHLPANVSLTKVFDTSHAPHKEFLGGFHRYMKQEWGCYVDIYIQKPVTHIVSDIIRRHGYEAIRFESRVENSFNIAVFPKNLTNGSMITLIDPQDGQEPTEMHTGNLNLFTP